MQYLSVPVLIGLLCCSVFTSADAREVAAPDTVPELSPGYLIGYLPQDALPDSLLLLPAPPEVNSAAFALDQSMAQQSQALRGSERWKLAIRDAELHFPAAAETFSCALNAPINERLTPRLYLLLRRTLTDAGLATDSAKKHYARTRPFVFNQQPSCTPDEEAKLAKNGSYPSGHSSIGWAWALLLSELSPAHSNAILARGRAYTESRLVCNVHWYSDIREGRDLGAATVARLHSDPIFQADFAAARQELAAVRAKGLGATGDCMAQAEALVPQPVRVSAQNSAPAPAPAAPEPKAPGSEP